MPMIFVNYWAILVAAIASMVIGTLWYGPFFAKAWMQELGKKESDLSQNAMMSMYGLTLIGSLVMSYVMAYVVGYAMATTAVTGGITGFWVWLGLIVPTMLSLKLFENRSWKLFAINTGYYLVTLVVMGMIFAAWH